MNQQTRRDFLRSAGLSATALFTARATWSQQTAGRPPNIILFLVDDMGWMDTTVHGSRYSDTPNMERLAKRSMMFTDAYTASPLCSPTRGSIMTGKHPARLGITIAAGHQPPLPPDDPLVPQQGPATQPVLLPQSWRHLRPEEYTIAEPLRDVGYATGHFGKWHLGLDPEHWPEEQGFQVPFHGAPDPGPPSYFSPYQSKAGTRVPLMVCWPGTVQAGSQCSEVVSSVDLYPTNLQMVGLNPKADQALDGETIVPLLRETGGLKREAIFRKFLGDDHPDTKLVRGNVEALGGKD